MELRGLTALVTGGARRVGAEIVRTLARAGVRVHIHYRSSAEAAQRLADALRAQGADIRTIQADLTDERQIDNLFAAIEADGQGLDVLVDNAGVYSRHPLEETPRDAWDTCLAVNLTAPFLCARHAARLMRARGGGVIVHVADIAGERGWPNHAAYSCSQAGRLMLTQVLALELAPHIRVNAVALGTVMWQDDTPSARKERIRSRIPLGRIGHPRHVADAVAFLIEQDFMTGATLHMDGGRRIVP